MAIEFVCPACRESLRVAHEAGRSVLFWLLVIAIVLSLLTAAACGGAFWLLGQPKWRVHDSANGGFKVELPADPNPDIAEQANLKRKPNERVEGTMLIGHLETY